MTSARGPFPLRERLKPILSIVTRDLRQIHRHGLPALVFLSVVLLLMGIVLFGMVGSEFRKRGVPEWTGPILGAGEGGDAAVTVSADRVTGRAPLNVSFTSAITGVEPPFTASWNFGDGNTSEAQNTSHAYATPGIYTATLTIMRPDRDNITASVGLIVSGDGDEPLRASISANRTGGRAPLAVAFTAAVAGGRAPYNYSWEFGDGERSNEPSPVHTYPAAPEGRKANLTVRDADGNVSSSNIINIEAGGGVEGAVSFTILDVVYGYAVLVTMMLVPAVFAGGYNHEMRKGTVRTLVCYPVGVLDITVAKLLYAFIAGLLFSAPVALIPALGSGMPGGEVAGVFLMAYILSFCVVTVAAFLANAVTFATKRMYLRPTFLPYLFVIYSFIFSFKILSFLIAVVSAFTGWDAAAVVSGFGPLTTLSPYHQGGLLLSGALGGPGRADAPVFLLPLLLLAAGVWFTRKLWPDIYEKE